MTMTARGAAHPASSDLGQVRLACLSDRATLTYLQRLLSGRLRACAGRVVVGCRVCWQGSNVDLTLGGWH